ncbi:SpoIIE family protein phosphatase [Kibdelosporangium persicum]|uniref:Serine phosphatase RsbU, regulator of sigma subunit n=1 Tax=Kibdelosporangium persicum TaxID=2698649 RepID=A0ABX2F8C3_9PSEU|nr:SpoIIE family protein phosphatase [Kibdelosporangium persicum]NRN67522.1 Serine phosphatase RsbU, regulator of sigma subunit [Kibdelosporangium persicum]
MGRAIGGDPADVARAFEHLPAVVWLLEGPEHIVVAANRAARASVGDLDLIGMPIRLAGKALPGTRLLDMLDEVYREGRTLSVQEPDALVTVRPLIDAYDVVTGLVAQVVVLADQPPPFRRDEHEVALDLQLAVLPHGLPVLPEISMAAVYLPAGANDAAGGDWFEVVPMPGGRLGLIVGDVVGHGPRASAIMGQLRAIVAERMLLGGELRDVVNALDTFARSAPEARGTTVCVAVLDRQNGSLAYCTRGHPPPLVVGANGDTRVLPQPSGPPLAFGDGEFMFADDVLWPGETIVLYSDGAVERPGRTIVEGIGELAACAAQVVRVNGTGQRALADRICQSGLQLIEDGHAPHDDASLLAVTVLLPFVDPLVMAVPASPEKLTDVRRELGRWLTDLRLMEEDLVAVELSVIEAVTNSIEHAYAEPGGTVQVEASLDDIGRLHIEVSDTGTWKKPDDEPGFRGRGMLMMRESMDEMRLATTSKGTVVEMCKTVRRPVRTGATRVAPARDEDLDDLRIDMMSLPDSLWLTVSGALDGSSAARLRSALLEAARGGSRLPITLVLDDVTALGSAGLRVLTEQGRRLGDAGRVLRVVASPNSPAGNVLSISGVDMLLDVRSHA